MPNQIIDKKLYLANSVKRGRAFQYQRAMKRAQDEAGSKGMGYV
jgi:hypothetical protein